MTEHKNQQAIDTITDVQVFYRTHDTASYLGIEGVDPKSCIWGALIRTGHAERHNSYGKLFPGEDCVLEALQATMVEYGTDENEYDDSGFFIGAYNDIRVHHNNAHMDDNKKRMRLWLRRAKAWLKDQEDC